MKQDDTMLRDLFDCDTDQLSPRQIRKRLRRRERYYDQDNWLREWASMVMGTSRRRALKRGLPHIITVEHCMSAIPVDGLCPILMIPLVFSRGRLVSHDDSATIDAITPELGYIPSNIHVISALANQMKARGSLKQMALMGAWALRKMTETK